MHALPQAHERAPHHHHHQGRAFRKGPTMGWHISLLSTNIFLFCHIVVVFSPPDVLTQFNSENNLNARMRSDGRSYLQLKRAVITAHSCI
jgi:hypothetical protein